MFFRIKRTDPMEDSSGRAAGEPFNAHSSVNAGVLLHLKLRSRTANHDATARLQHGPGRTCLHRLLRKNALVFIVAE
jgi:hypothetical protein